MRVPVSPQSRAAGTLLVLVLALSLWLPRALALDRYVTDDERLWLARSANFYQALSAGDFAATYQREHPGVTVMWAGTAAFLWRYPQYVQDVSGQIGWDVEEIGPLLRAHGYSPMDLLAAGRLVLVLAITSIVLLAFLYASRLLGSGPALFGFLLIAFDPYHIALSRLLHMDALLSSLLLLAVLAFVYAQRTGTRRALMVSGAATGLAIVTKVPGLFLIPFVGLLLGWQFWRERDETGGVGDIMQPALLWAGVVLLVVVLLWPALWVAPIDTLRRTLAGSFTYATGEANMTTIFFAGEVFRETDPGPTFYPLNFLWRTTPIVLLGLPAALLALLARRLPFANDRHRYTAIVLLLFAMLYLLAMTIGAKKLDRYMLPAVAPIDVLAALGWFAVFGWLKDLVQMRSTGYVAAGGIVLATGVQVTLAFATFPYFLSYFNPLMGGSENAPKALMIGRGEGLDQAAAYLNAKPEAESLRILTWSTDNIAYLLDGTLVSPTLVSDPEDEPTVEDLLDWVTLDYAVLYVQQWQRRLPPLAMLAYFDARTPEKVIYIDGIQYARIYNLRGALPPDFLVIGAPERLTDWAGAIRLLSYEVPTEPVHPGEEFTARFYLQNIAPMERNVNVLVRVVGPDGRELLRDEGWPWGAPTSQWPQHQVRPDGHTFTVPPGTPAGYYRVELSFYDPNTLEPLPALDAHTGESIGRTRVVAYLTIGDVPSEPRRLLSPPAVLGQKVALLGANIDGDTPDPGETLTVRLFWQAENPLTNEYTAFVHLIGPDGELAAQHDKRPLDGFIPMTLWRPERVMTDIYELAIPADAKTGKYTLYAGMYDPNSLERLPVQGGSKQAGDSAEIGTVTIE